MTELVETAVELQSLCEHNDWEFCIIGGLALQFWGEQRLTKDVDLTVLTGVGNEEIYIDKFLVKFASRIGGAREFALRSRVLLLKTESGVGVDVSLGAVPFEAGMVARAVYKEYLPGITLKICTAEDLIVLKAFAARPRDWNDIETVLIKQSALDWKYILEQLTPLAGFQDKTDILAELGERRKEFYQE